MELDSFSRTRAAGFVERFYLSSAGLSKNDEANVASLRSRDVYAAAFASFLILKSVVSAIRVSEPAVGFASILK